MASLTPWIASSPSLPSPTNSISGRSICACDATAAFYGLSSLPSLPPHSRSPSSLFLQNQIRSRVGREGERGWGGLVQSVRVGTYVRCGVHSPTLQHHGWSRQCPSAVTRARAGSWRRAEEAGATFFGGGGDGSRTEEGVHASRFVSIFLT